MIKIDRDLRSVYYALLSAISKVIEIKEAIEIVLGVHVCDRDQVGVDHDKRSRSDRYAPHQLIHGQEGDRDQGDDRDRDQGSNM